MLNGSTTLIQMKDLGEDNIVHFRNATKIDAAPNINQLLKAGDIVFRSRGQNNTAAIVTQEFCQAIVAAPLFRIRAKQNEVLPEYLLWFINQPQAQTFFATRAKGTRVKMISKQALEELEIALPHREIQRKIAEIYGLAREEQALMEALKGRKEKYIQGILMRAASESR